MGRRRRAGAAGWRARRWAPRLRRRRLPRTPPANPASTTGGSDPAARQPPTLVSPRSTPRTASPRRDPRRTQPRAPRTAACTRRCPPSSGVWAGSRRRFHCRTRCRTRPPLTRHLPSPTTRSPIQRPPRVRRRTTRPGVALICPAQTRSLPRRFRSCPWDRSSASRPLRCQSPSP